MWDYLIKLLLCLVLNWVYDHTVKPIKHYICVRLEDEGILMYNHSISMPFTRVISTLKNANESLKLHKDLPTTDETMLYFNEYGIRFHMELIYFASEWLNQQEKLIYNWESRQNFLLMQSEIKKRMKIHDLFDDLERPYIHLYIKRIKLCQIKELLGAKSYENLKAPHIIPPEFIPDP